MSSGPKNAEDDCIKERRKQSNSHDVKWRGALTSNPRRPANNTRARTSCPLLLKARGCEA